MKRLLCLLLVSGFMFSFAEVKKPDGTKLEPRRTVIAGIVENYTEDMNFLIVNLRDFLSDEQEIMQIITASDGYFHVEHDYLFAQDITIHLNNRLTQMFVTPGDSIFVKIDAGTIYDYNYVVRFSGDNSDLNDEFSRWCHYSSRNIRNFSFDIDSTTEDLLEAIKSNFASVQDSIESYSQRNGMSDLLKDWAFADHKFSMAVSLGYYFYKNDYVDKWAISTDPVFDIFNENNFRSMNFPSHFSLCMTSLVWSDVELMHLFAEKEYVLAIRQMIDKLHRKAPEGIVRDAMLFNFLKMTLKGMPELYDSLPEIKTAFTNGFFAEELEKTVDKSKMTEGRELSEKETVLYGVLYLNGEKTEKLPDAGILNYLAERYKDKVLYIDVWGTWCGGCIVAIEQYSPGLHKHFEGKDVVFVNLCLLSGLERWLPAIKTHNVAGENYFLDTDSSNQFMGENNLSGLPSYLIIDKEGKLHNSAPHPADLSDAIKKIESLLK